MVVSVANRVVVFCCINRLLVTVFSFCRWNSPAENKREIDSRFHRTVSQTSVFRRGHGYDLPPLRQIAKQTEHLYRCTKKRGNQARGGGAVTAGVSGGLSLRPFHLPACTHLVAAAQGPAANGQLVFLCGGDKDLFDRATKDLDLMGKVGVPSTPASSD